ncbi:Ig-like domain-containing protein [Paenibacillus glycanilyticus]|uniref:Ig-like domain-containing protein n=1 Tax=Paenibacillus glycanilyticus TaxID=126569 RepID=UPI00203B3E3B|nr:Ig-like domain-containing protein [Paenibacillus glycanilyticus]MCM3628096.1 Ig-like domain-containing protein [Paenibacillus glycanilyticus]
MLQLFLSGWATNTTNVVHAASSGPIVVGMSPADNATGITPQSDLTLTFDEAVTKGSDSAVITIYNYNTSDIVESIPMASYKIRLDATGRVATINPDAVLNVNTDYYVLIDYGAFANVSNGAYYAGISSAAAWNFRTTSVVDTTGPSITLKSPDTGATQVPVDSKVIIQFNEPLYAASGYVTLSSVTDTKNIPVTSSMVQGSGTNTIRITPSEPLDSNADYTVTIPRTAFQDGAGNAIETGGASYVSWSFHTDLAPLNIVSVTPAKNATSVSVLTDMLTIKFDHNVAAGTEKYIEIKDVKNNNTFARIKTSSAQVAINGATASITLPASPRFSANSSYYVLVDNGAFIETDSGSNYPFPGISNASAWSFTTGYGNDTTKPALKTLSPQAGGILTATTGKLVLTFTEPVFQDSGTIEIRTVTGGTLFRSIPVTSGRVSGGGTDTITIDATSAYGGEVAKAFVNNTSYYVTVGSRAFKDGVGLYFDGLTSSSSWRYTVTQDNVKPTLAATSPANNSVSADPNAALSATFSEAVQSGDGQIWIQCVSNTSSTCVTPRVGTSVSVDPLNNKKLIITPVQALQAGAVYYVVIEPDAVTDLAGNAYYGIQNEYQWTFKTLGGDTTAPAIAKLEANGSTIIMTYNEDLMENSIPTAGSFYITVDGAYRSVTGVSVSGPKVTLNLSSTIVDGQQVKLSYTKPSVATSGIRDLSGNQALSLASQTVTTAVDTTKPQLTGGTAAGGIVTLIFSENLASVSSYAYYQFSVYVGSNYYTPTSVYSTGNKVILAINASIDSSASVRVSYSAGSYPLQDAAGNKVNDFSSYALTGTGDTSAPALQSIEASGSSILISYNKTLDSSRRPSTSQYTVIVNNSVRSVSQVTVSGSQVLLSVSPDIPSGSTVKVSYSKSYTALVDLAGNEAAAFSNVTASVGNGSSSDNGLYGAVVKGTKLTLSFWKTLSSSYVPSSAYFSVKVDNSADPATNVTVSGNTVVLTLAKAPGVGDSVTITYYATSTNSLRTSDGTLISSFTNVTVANQTTLIDSLPGGYEEANGGGIGLTPSMATQTSDVSPAGYTTTRYTIQSDKLLTAYTSARSAGINNARVVFEVPSSERAAVVAVPLTALESAYRSSNGASFAVQYGTSSYEIPLSALAFKSMASLIGSSSTTGNLLIKIEKGNNSKTSALTSAISKAGASLLSTPITFETSVVNGTTEKTLSEFGGYVKRSFESLTSVNATNSAVVWLDPQTGKLSYVPTTFSTENGSNMVSFKRKGNSAYALVSGSSKFTDIGSHWAGSTIKMMANKFIIEGRSGSTTKFDPQSSITRAEFASYIVRGLGLSGNRSEAAKYKDVASGTAAAAYIGAASKAGIVMGNTDGTFKPNSPITRQEMAVMMSRAAKAAAVTISLPQSESSYLSKFSDRTKVASWAKSDLAKAVYIGVITGQTETTFGPTKNATRAEAIVMIKRLLEYVDLLN